MSLKHEIEIIFFVLLASIITLLAYFYGGIGVQKGSNHLRVDTLLSNVFVSVTPLPDSSSVSSPRITESSWLSSDGEEKITMKAIKNRDETNTYIFTLTNTTTHVDSNLFTQTVATASSMAIPFNAFSSDNSYVYLGQNDNGIKHFLVFKTSLERIDERPYIDVGELFSAFTSSYTISEVTGWTSESLLIVNAKSVDGKEDVTFWLDMSTLRFIRISTFFP